MGTIARGIVSDGSGSLSVAEIELPDPGPHQVLVRQFASGICHSQLNELRQGRSGPALFGHESSGVVVATGDDVVAVSEGDQVVVTWLAAKGALMTRDLNFPRVRLAGGAEATYDRVFTWADHTLIDEAFAVKVGPMARPDLTAVVGCAVMTGAGAVLRTAGVGVGASVAVFGVGGVGLSVVAAARISGADPVIAVDLDNEKLALARRLGASHVVDASVQEPVATLRRLAREVDVRRARGCIRAEGVDFAFDCIGLPETVGNAVEVVRRGDPGLRRGGVAVLVGVPQVRVGIDALGLLVGEKTVLGSLGGSCEPARDIPLFLRWHEEGRMDLDALVTERYHMEEIEEATKRLAEGKILGRAVITF
jgi:Zn-dependent alcohol dehydrogenase